MRVSFVVWIALILNGECSSAPSPEKSGAARAPSDALQRSQAFQTWKASAESEAAAQRISEAPTSAGGARELVKRLLLGSKLLFRDVMEWRKLRKEPRVKLDYEEWRLVR